MSYFLGEGVENLCGVCKDDVWTATACEDRCEEEDGEEGFHKGREIGNCGFEWHVLGGSPY